jgi:orotate phosphoribosyltransferase
LELLRTHSFQRKRVTLASGKVSDFFIDCKRTVLLADGHALAAELMLDALSQWPGVHAVAGVALGGCPLASAVSTMSHIRGRPLPALYVRKERKEHGTQKMIEGQIHEGMNVVLLEDVITTGGSTLHAIQMLRSHAMRVVGVVVLVDRLEGGAEALRQVGVECVSLYTRHDFIREADESLEVTLVDFVPPGEA